MELSRTLDPGSWQQLQDAQAKWDAYTEATCEWAANQFAGGSIATMQYTLCLHGHTAMRIDELKVFLCEGPGLIESCEASERY